MPICEYVMRAVWVFPQAFPYQSGAVVWAECLRQCPVVEVACPAHQGTGYFLSLLRGMAYHPHESCTWTTAPRHVSKAYAGEQDVSKRRPCLYLAWLGDEVRCGFGRGSKAGLALAPVA